MCTQIHTCTRTHAIRACGAVASMLQRSWDSLPLEIVLVLCAELSLPDDEMERYI